MLATREWLSLAASGSAVYLPRMSDFANHDTTLPTQRSFIDGAYVGGPALNVTGLADGTNGAVRFDGNDDVVRIENSPVLNTSLIQQRTVELWFNADNTSGRQILFEEGGTGRGISIYLDGSTLYAGAWNTVNDASADTPWGPIFHTSAVSAGQTYHVVLVLNGSGGSLSASLNGSSFGSSSSAGVLWGHGSKTGVGGLYNAVRFHDGTDTGTSGYGFDGVIDEVAIYNYALSSGRISAHYAAGTP